MLPASVEYSSFTESVRGMPVHKITVSAPVKYFSPPFGLMILSESCAERFCANAEAAKMRMPMMMWERIIFTGGNTEEAVIDSNNLRGANY